MSTIASSTTKDLHSHCVNAPKGKLKPVEHPLLVMFYMEFLNICVVSISYLLL